jgi:hypothetical protein
MAITEQLPANFNSEQAREQAAATMGRLTRQVGDLQRRLALSEQGVADRTRINERLKRERDAAVEELREARQRPATFAGVEEMTAELARWRGVTFGILAALRALEAKLGVPGPGNPPRVEEVVARIVVEEHAPAEVAAPAEPSPVSVRVSGGKVCSVEWCEASPNGGRGLCRAHAWRKRQNGSEYYVWRGRDGGRAENKHENNALFRETAQGAFAPVGEVTG